MKNANNKTTTENKEIPKRSRRGKYHRNTRTRKLDDEAWNNTSTTWKRSIKDRDILKIATTKRGGALSGRYEICVWTLKPGVLDGEN